MNSSRLFNDSVMNKKELLEFVIKNHFSKINFDLIGKLKWKKPTERQKERYFKKNGLELKKQRIKYEIEEIYWQKPIENTKSDARFKFYIHILISEIEKQNIFYCIIDNCFGGRMGEKMRYKFKIHDGNPSIKNLKIEHVESKVIAIR